MNRKNLTAAVLAGLAGVVGIAGSAQAVNINPDGTGQVLLYPYYTTNGGNVTLLSVVNTSDDAKAVKVRFMESENSQEVLDFNLYMSAYDVWTAAINPMPADAMYDDCDPNLEDDTAVVCEGPLLNIAADETTCIVPNFGTAQPFLPFQYQYSPDGDGGSQSQARMNEGHFEMIEMGTLIESETDAEGNNVASLPGQWAEHVDTDGVWAPADCEALNDAWTRSIPFDKETSGAWIKDPTFGVEAPSGGLFGGAAIVNPMQGSMHTYDAVALNGWNTSGFELGEFAPSIHAEPGTIKPDLDSGDTAEALVFGEQGELLTSGELEDAIDAVSYVLMHDTMMNEYTTETGVAGETEWVVTFPTKRFYVNNTIEPIAPFTKIWAPVGDADLATACEVVELRTMWDREERTELPDEVCETDCGEKPPVVSPPRPGTPPDEDEARIPFELCYETNVIRFGAGTDADGEPMLPDATEILGTPQPLFRNIDNEALNFQYGWARIDLDDYLEAVPVYGDKQFPEVITDYDYNEKSRDPIGAEGADALNGLPFVGFSVSRFSNGFIPVEGGQDVFSSYGGLWKHKSSRKVGS